MIAGHDWGAPVAWHAALLRPDLFRAVIGLSVPFRPRGAVRPTIHVGTTARVGNLDSPVVTCHGLVTFLFCTAVIHRIDDPMGRAT